MKQEYITVKGAREHNLKNIDVKIPRNQFVVITGLSGSGKSSLAFDTIYAEGQRRYLESLSSYARQFLEKLGKPDVDSVAGLSPSISIEQKQGGNNPRSTVATVTEIYDYMRLLYAKAGTVTCFKCGQVLGAKSLEEIAENILAEFEGEKIQVLAPIVIGRKGEFGKVFQDVLKKGYSRGWIDGKWVSFTPDLKLHKNRRHDIDICVERLTVSADKRDRLVAALELAKELVPDGLVILTGHQRGGETSEGTKRNLFSLAQNCSKCDVNIPALAPNMFSFNSPYGACSKCNGLGRISQMASSGLIVDEAKPLLSGALNKEIFFSFNKYFIEDALHELTQKFENLVARTVQMVGQSHAF